MKLRKILEIFLLTVSVLMSTSASALVQDNPNGIYMIGASVNVQLYNQRELTGPGRFGSNQGVINKDNPLYFSNAVDNRDKIFWGQIPNNYDLHFVPAKDSNITSMMKEYRDKVTEADPFAPIIPGFVLVGWVGSMCQAPNHAEGLNEIKLQIYNLILNANSSTNIVLMKYPTEGLSFSGCTGDYISNAKNYNGYIEILRLWFASVSVIDPWKNYATKFPGDTVHADDRTLEDAAIRIRECFENGLPLYCKNKP